MQIAVIHDYADIFRRTRAYPRLQEHEVIIHTDASTDPARVIAPAARRFSPTPTCSACTCLATTRPVVLSRRTTWLA
jgi:hypothetical protein